MPLVEKQDHGRYTVDDIVCKLKSLSNPGAKEGMVRYGIVTDKALGISIPDLRRIAKEIGTDHALSLELWDTGIHEACILSGMIDDPALITEDQMDRWAGDFSSWDLCDQCCSNLFDRTGFAYEKCLQWTQDEREYVKRAGFVMMATLAVHDKKAPDDMFRKFFPVIVNGSTDERNFVKKAVNWALRQIGKRNMVLNHEAIAVAMEIQKKDSKSARWIASDALRELRSEGVQRRIMKKCK